MTDVPAKRALRASAGRTAVQGSSLLLAGNGSPFEQDAVGWDEIAHAQHNDIARDKGADRHSGACPIAKYVGANRHRTAQRVGCLLGAVFLNDVEHQRERDHRDNDQEAPEIAADARNCRGHD
jgi:hypothetical protein